MRIILMLVALTAPLCLADTLVLKNGRAVNGTYLGGTARQVRMAVGDRVETYDLTEVARIEFGAASAASAAPSRDDRPTLRRAGREDSDSGRPTLRRAPSADNADDDARPTLRREPVPVLRPDPVETAAASAPAGPLNIDLPGGTAIAVRMIDAVDSERHRVGQTFQASVDEPVVVNGETVIPRGADALVKLIDDQESGKLTGKTVLTLDLAAVKVNGRMVDLLTSGVQQSSTSRGARTAKVAGGAAAAGAIIGAIAGGGRGAAIGAGAGGAAGAGAEMATRGQRVRVPAETRLTFTLQSATRI
jgi:hypothetical protein